MAIADTKKIINRINNMTLQEKRAWRSIVTAIYADNVDSNLTDAEVKTAYQSEVPLVSQAVAEAGTATGIESWSAERVKQAIAALETASFVGGDYYAANGAGATTYYLDNVVGYESGMIRPIRSTGATSSGITGTNGLAARATISAVTANGGASTNFATASAHGLVAGDLVTQTGYGGDEAYNQLAYIEDVADTTHFQMPTPYTANLTGTVIKPGIVTFGTTGTYKITHSGIIESAQVLASGAIKVFKNDSLSNSTFKYTFDNIGANIETPYSYSFYNTYTAGDDFGFAMSAFNWGATFTHRNYWVTIEQVA